MKLKLLIAVAAVASSLATLPALATDASSTEVRYGDLDLVSDAGTSALYSRLRHASRRVCGSADLRNLREYSAMQSCRVEALDRAVDDVGSARLSALHEGREAPTRFVERDGKGEAG